MQYREYSPLPRLRRQVRCLWTLRSDSSDEAAVEDIVPDGCAELVINRADRFLQVLPDGKFQNQGRLLIAGQMSRPLRIRPTGKVDLIGVRFEPGGLFPFLSGLPLAEITEQRIDLFDLDPRLGNDIEAAAHSAADSLHSIQALLLGRLTESAGARSLAEEAAREIEQNSGKSEIRSLKTAAKVSERTMQRTFLREVGIGPKLFARIVRFQAFLQWAESGIPLSRLALDCGYFDQAHVNRDCQRFTGKSPSKFLGEDHLLSDFFTGLASDSPREASKPE